MQGLYPVIFNHYLDIGWEAPWTVSLAVTLAIPQAGRQAGKQAGRRVGRRDNEHYYNSCLLVNPAKPWLLMINDSVNP